MARTIEVIPQPPAVVCAGTWLRHSAPQRQREESAGTTSEPSLATKMRCGIRLPRVGWIGYLPPCACSLASPVLYDEGMIWFTISDKGKERIATPRSRVQP